MAVTPKLYVRSLSGVPLSLPKDITFSVGAYSFAAMGGPKQATINVAGPLDALVQAFNWLRCPVELISHPREDKVWWGYVSEVRVQIGQVETIMTLDSMSNSVSVSYVKLDSPSATVGTRANTTDVLNTDSIAEYGTKIQRVTLNNATAAQALLKATNELAIRAYPQNIGPSLGVSAQSVGSATLVCRGWWETMRWKYYAHAQDTEVTSVVTNQNHKFAHGDYPDMIAQQFSLVSSVDSWWAVDVEISMYSEINDWKTNTAYFMYADIRANTAGLPGAVLATSIGVPPDQIQGGPGRFTFPTPYPLVGGTTYWIVVYSNIGGDTYWQIRHNYIDTFGNGAPYARGSLAWYFSGAWNVYTDRAINMRIGGLQDTAKQVLNIVSAAGQFMTSSRLAGFTTSSVLTSAYRDGDRTGYAEAEELLSNGTTSYLRMLPYVTPERQVVIRLEPLPTSTPTFKLDRQMALYDANDNRISAEYCPAGIWCALKDVFPPSASFSKLSAPSPFFIEEATYDPRATRYTPSPRALGNIYKVGILQ